MTRVLAVLALAVPVVLGLVLLAAPSAAPSWLGENGRTIVAALAASTIAVCLTSGVVHLVRNLRLRRLVRAAEP